MSLSLPVPRIFLKMVCVSCMVCLLSARALAQGGGNTGTATPPVTPAADAAGSADEKALADKAKAAGLPSATGTVESGSTINVYGNPVRAYPGSEWEVHADGTVDIHISGGSGYVSSIKSDGTFTFTEPPLHNVINASRFLEKQLLREPYGISVLNNLEAYSNLENFSVGTTWTIVIHPFKRPNGSSTATIQLSSKDLLGATETYTHSADGSNQTVYARTNGFVRNTTVSADGKKTETITRYPDNTSESETITLNPDLTSKHVKFNRDNSTETFTTNLDGTVQPGSVVKTAAKSDTESLFSVPPPEESNNANPGGGNNANPGAGNNLTPEQQDEINKIIDDATKGENPAPNPSQPNTPPPQKGAEPEAPKSESSNSQQPQTTATAEGASGAGTSFAVGTAAENSGSATVPSTSVTVAMQNSTVTNFATTTNDANAISTVGQSSSGTSVAVNPTGGTVGPTSIPVPACSDKDCADKRAKYDTAIADAIKAGNKLIEVHANGEDDTTAQTDYTKAAKAAMQAFDDAYGNIANMPLGGAGASSAGEQPAGSTGAATGTANGSGNKSYAEREAEAKAKEQAADRTDTDIAQFFFETLGNPYWFLFVNSYWEFDPPKHEDDPPPPMYPEHSVIRELTEELVVPDSPSEFTAPSATPTNPVPQTPAPAPQQGSGGGVSFHLLPTFIDCDGSSCAAAAKTPQGLLKISFPGFNSDIGKSAETMKAAVTTMVKSILPQQLNAMQAGSSQNPVSPTELFSGSLTSEETNRLLTLFPRGGPTWNCTPSPAQGNNAGETDSLVVVTNSRGIVSRPCPPTPAQANNAGQPGTPVTVTEIPPFGLTVTNMSGRATWTCTVLPAQTSSGGQITVPSTGLTMPNTSGVPTWNCTPPSTSGNIGGQTGAPPAGITVTEIPPTGLTVTKMSGDTSWTCTVSPAPANNDGQSGAPVTVTEVPPTGLTVTNMSGSTTWDCTTRTPTYANNGGQPGTSTSLPGSSTNGGSGAGVANAGSPSGETITRTSDSKYSTGGTKETTRDDSTGATIKEEFKNAKGTTKRINYITKTDSGAVRTDRLLYRDDGTPTVTFTTITAPDGSSVEEHFSYDSEGINITDGGRVETAANGTVTSYAYDPNSGEWVTPVQLTKEQTLRIDSFIKEQMDAFLNSPKTANPAPPPPSVVPSSLPGYQATTTAFPGLNNTVFTTPSGTVTVHMPNDMSAGDTISGTVEEQTNGKTDPERAQNQTTLGGYMLTIGQLTIPATEKSFTQQIPTTLTPTTGTVSLTLNGKTVATVQVPVATTQPSLPSAITMPTGGTQGSSLAITEPTNGIFDSSDYVKLGETTLPELAESPRQKIVLLNTEIVGESTLEDRENGNVTRCTFRVLGIRLSAPQLSLLKGQTTILTTTVVGLKGITKDSPLDLTNFSDTVINMAEGNEQHLTIHPSEVSADGTYSVQRVLTGIRAGGFRITGTVRWDNTFSRTLPTLGGAGTSTTRGGITPTYVLTPALARLDALGRDWCAKRGAWDLAGIRYIKALDDGMSTADKGKVKAYEQAQNIRWDALMKNMEANTNDSSGGNGQNAKAADDARAKLKEADDKASAATRAAIDTMAPDKKKTVEQSEAALQQAASESASAATEYVKNARATFNR